VLEELLTGTCDVLLAKKLRDTYAVFTSGKANGTGSFPLHTQSRVVMRGSRSRPPSTGIPTIPQSLQKTRSLVIMAIAQARARVRLFVRMHVHAWHAAAVIADLKVAAHIVFARRLVRMRMLLQAVRRWRSRASTKTSTRSGCIYRSMLRMNYRRSAAAVRCCIWHWRFIVPLSKRVTSQVQSMSWFHNSQLREWVHGCVTASITHAPAAPSTLPPPPSNERVPPSKMLAAAAALATTHVVTEKAKVIIEVRSLPASPWPHRCSCLSWLLLPHVAYACIYC